MPKIDAKPGILRCTGLPGQFRLETPGHEGVNVTSRSCNKLTEWTCDRADSVPIIWFGLAIHLNLPQACNTLKYE
jgi:hypothetical protein